ncbi:HIRAN domain-containing protein [Sphingobium sp. AP50]|uniref:HIRAN domain-containing protein n=1 Tax=Sphingobium sp. AP50 TaxID=1884369 RepID=UPI0008C1691B|nr:HIRAN domain-containing protein [Sphingobium sp. AP50]SEK02099.1 HIRAN domain-containing protein [Sphingobium sp. AP50]
MPQELSLAVVGALYPNADGSNRLFEIRMLNPGDRILLQIEPSNPTDPSAVAVYSHRGYQIGYLSAERCGWVGGKIRLGLDVRAIFQHHLGDGAIIRIRFDGSEPSLPPRPPEPALLPEQDEDGRRMEDPESGFWPDFIPPDD